MELIRYKTKHMITLPAQVGSLKICRDTTKRWSSGTSSDFNYVVQGGLEKLRVILRFLGDESYFSFASDSYKSLSHGFALQAPQLSLAIHRVA